MTEKEIIIKFIKSQKLSLEDEEAVIKSINDIDLSRDNREIIVRFIRNRGSYLNFSEEDINLCIYYFVDILEHKEILEKSNKLGAAQSSANKKGVLKQRFFSAKRKDK